jgi:hypothetical protein
MIHGITLVMRDELLVVIVRWFNVNSNRNYFCR